ncbi:MAG: exodeoxyribonuclease VII large subunit [Rhodobiaceae bacterium]|nr:exodeoxyribonuclease VII large subunit [Rhodobiaceae bacterium]RPF97230.1 MAG: exodeoxyribonuclease VII large subunit [Rhizobiales bacterium TMED227]
MFFVNENIPEFSVSEISNEIKKSLEEGFGYVRIKGEISGLKISKNGIVYLSLKEEKDLINAIIWPDRYRNLDVKPEEGLEVIASGKITTYSKGISTYQIHIENIELAGEGLLKAKFEKLKKQLLAEGIFDEVHKQILPKYPKSVAIVTSLTGSVIRDILKVFNDNGYPSDIFIVDVPVQGEKCPIEISEVIERLNDLNSNKIRKPDIILVARGGGSYEDLWGFNDEILVRSVFNSGIPIVSAIGHETDESLTDLVADFRAATPTAAANKIFPKIDEIYSNINSYQNRLNLFMHDEIKKSWLKLKYLKKSFSMIGTSSFQERLLTFKGIFGRLSKKSLEDNIDKKNSKLNYSGNLLLLRADNIISTKDNHRISGSTTLDFYSKNMITEKKNAVQSMLRLLESMDYKNILNRGYTVIKSSDDKIITSAKGADEHQSMRIIFSDGDLDVTHSKK